MKTTITNVKRLCTLLIAALAFAACGNDTDDIAGQEPVQPAKGDITFTAVFAVKNPGTRALTESNNTLTASWEQGEEIAIVFGGNKYVATVTAVDGAGNATVSATLPGNTPNNQAVTFIYPASAVDEYGTPIDLLSSQDGTLATVSSTLDVATADGTIVIDGTSAQPNGTVTLQNQFAVCKFQFKDENNQAITDVKKLTITDLATQDKYTVTTPSAQPAVYVAMLPSNNSMKFEVETASGLGYDKTASAKLQPGMFYHPTLQLINPWVDLGLPSGTKWATHNVGARSPEEYGDYFAWGETKPKSDYSWSTYKWIYAGGTEWTDINKYTFADGQTNGCWYNSNGEFIGDNLTELLPEDDAATANWGSGWQMPSQAQCEELYNSNYTTIEWTTLNDVNGWKITSKRNGNSIFLPAAGVNHGESYLLGYNNTCVCLSRVLFKNRSDAAYALYNYHQDYEDLDYVMVDMGYRSDGLSVRPVRKQ